VALYHVFPRDLVLNGARNSKHTAFGNTWRQSRRAADAGSRPAPRQAFLLTALEGFTPSEAAQILETRFEEVEQLIADAQAEIDAELATEVLIIEDEPVIRGPTSRPWSKILGHRVAGHRRHPRRGAREAIARRAAGPGAGRHPASGRFHPASTRSRTSSGDSTCR